MSETEVTKELTKDIGDLLRYSDINFDKKFRRDVIHADTFPIHRRYTWRSRNKNPWTVIYEARGKKDVGDHLENRIKVEFKKGHYNDMQKVTCFGEGTDALKEATALREIGEFMFNNFKELV